MPGTSPFPIKAFRSGGQLSAAVTGEIESFVPVVAELAGT